MPLPESIHAPPALLPPPVDEFIRAVPDASLDICILIRSTAATTDTTHTQLLLRALCTLPNHISRAGMQDDRLDVLIDDMRLCAGRVTDIDTLSVHRPDLPGTDLVQGRMGFLLARHDIALRLRLDRNTPNALLTAICTLVLDLFPAQAVILRDDLLMLTAQEFIQHLLNGRTRIARGQPLARPMPRLKRPQDDNMQARSDPSGVEEPAASPPSRPSLFRRASSAERTPTDPVQSLIEGHQQKHNLIALARTFRNTSGQNRSGWRKLATDKSQGVEVSFLQDRPSPSANADEIMLCDAVLLARRGRVQTLMAPVLLATAILFMSLSGPMRPGTTAPLPAIGAAVQTVYSA